MGRTEGPIYIGIGGHLVAIDRATGSERWRCKLRSSTFITIAVEKDAVYAGATGELYCIDPSTGTIRWHNRLKGLGHSIIAFGGSSAAVVAAAAMAHAAMIAASSAG